MAIDSKYGRVQVEHGTIADDEPVVLFRAQDKLLPAVLAHYEQLCRDNGSPERHLMLIRNERHAVATWQDQHHTQVPQSTGLIDN